MPDNMIKSSLLIRVWAYISHKLKIIVKEIHRWAPIVTLGNFSLKNLLIKIVIALLLFIRFRKASKETELKFSKDDFIHVFEKLKKTLGQMDTNNEAHVQKMVVSKFIKYLFTNYAKLALL